MIRQLASLAADPWASEIKKGRQPRRNLLLCDDLALSLIGELIVIVRKVAHQDMGVSVFHRGYERPHLKSAISEIFRSVRMGYAHRSAFTSRSI
jgi:hypothetical protein